MYVASDSHSDLPVFPLLERASRHDMLSFLHSFFTMKAYLPEFRLEKLLLDSAHAAYAVYEYCRQENITPFLLCFTFLKYRFGKEAIEKKTVQTKKS